MKIFLEEVDPFFAKASSEMEGELELQRDQKLFCSTFRELAL